MAFLRFASATEGAAPPATPIVAAITINVGERGVMAFGATEGSPTITAFSAGGVTWSLQKKDTFVSGNTMWVELWASDGPLTSQITSLSVAYTGVEPDATMLIVAAYDDPAGGIHATTATAENTILDPSLSLTLHTGGNIMIAAIAGADAAAATAKAGSNFRASVGVAGNSDGFLALVDNTNASPVSVTCACTHAASTWDAVAMEFITAAAGGGTPPMFRGS